MSKREAFLDALASQVNKGIFVWGGNGENLLCMGDPIAWIRKKETLTANADRAIALFENRVADGIDPIRAFDCSGLVYWCQKVTGYGYDDHTANGWYRECNKVNELSEGDLVFHHNGIKCTHVGVYVGGNTVVEAKGRDVGVVATVYSTNAKYWNRQGRLKKMEDPSPVEPTQVKMTGSLCVREEGRKDSKRIGYASKGKTYPLCGYADSGWYRIEYKPGMFGFISDKTKYTVLI